MIYEKKGETNDNRRTRFGKRNHCLKENVAKFCFKFSKNYRSYKKLAISNNRKSFLSNTHGQIKNSYKVETPYEFLVRFNQLPLLT